MSPERLRSSRQVVFHCGSDDDNPGGRDTGAGHERRGRIEYAQPSELGGEREPAGGEWHDALLVVVTLTARNTTASTAGTAPKPRMILQSAS
jgi:hypothetical protein